MPFASSRVGFLVEAMDGRLCGFLREVSLESQRVKFKRLSL